MGESEKGSAFGQRLRQCRKEAGLTQKQVQVATGLSQGGISELENGTFEVSRFTPALADLYGVNAFWLATGSGPKQTGTEGLSPLVLAAARDMQKLPADIQLKIKHYIDVELTIAMQQRALERQDSRAEHQAKGR